MYYNVIRRSTFTEIQDGKTTSFWVEAVEFSVSMGTSPSTSLTSSMPDIALAPPQQTITAVAHGSKSQENFMINMSCVVEEDFKIIN